MCPSNLLFLFFCPKIKSKVQFYSAVVILTIFRFAYHATDVTPVLGFTCSAKDDISITVVWLSSIRWLHSTVSFIYFFICCSLHRRHQPVPVNYQWHPLDGKPFFDEKHHFWRPEGYNCNCWRNAKEFSCVHSLGVAIMWNTLITPQAAIAQLLGRKRARGRRPQIPGAWKFLPFVINSPVHHPQQNNQILLLSGTCSANLSARGRRKSGSGIWSLSSLWIFLKITNTKASFNFTFSTIFLVSNFSVVFASSKL